MRDPSPDVGQNHATPYLFLCHGAKEIHNVASLHLQMHKFREVLMQLKQLLGGLGGEKEV